MLPFEPAAGIAMEVYDAGKVFAGTVVRLVVTALQFQSLFVNYLNIGAFDFHGVPFEQFAAWVGRKVPRSVSEY